MKATDFQDANAEDRRLDPSEIEVETSLKLEDPHDHDIHRWEDEGGPSHD